MDEAVTGEERSSSAGTTVRRQPARRPPVQRLFDALRMTLQRFHYYGYSRWIVASLVIVVAGTLIALVGDHAVASTDAQSSHLAFERSSSAIAATVTLGLEHEQDLSLAAGALVVDDRRESETQFLTWARAIRADQRYPELVGIGFVVLVRARALIPFAERMSRELLLGGRSAPEKVPPPSFQLTPIGRRPVYCLSSLAYARRAALAPPSGEDFCAGQPLWASRASGRSSVAIVHRGGATILRFVSPVYRGGRVPTTTAGRLHAFLGWTEMEIQPTVLLLAALRGHPGIDLALHTGPSSAAIIRDGSSSSASAVIHARLNDGATLETYGANTASGLFSDGTAVSLLAVGMLLTFLLALLTFLLGTGRARALRIAEESAVQLSEQLVLSSLARDEAVEASNAKSVFVAMVSHELRTPLSGVIGTSELLLETKLEPLQREYAEIVRSSSEGLLLVINDILDYSKIEADKLELETMRFSLDALIGECAATLASLASGKGIALEVADAEPLGWVRGDPGRLRQVLINLLSNAVKFTNAGCVRLSARTTSTGQGLRLRVEVTDTGIGIDAEALEQIFQPFTQADTSTARRYGGTGLGLTISARLVELMGGEIGADSRPGTGSTFWFEVPLSAAGQAPATGEGAGFSPRGPRDEDGKLTDEAPLVLVAEDTAVNQMLAARILDKCGYRSVVVGNGLEALDAVERDSYVAILMDCQMPEMDGYDATRAIRRREAAGDHVPIVATTAHSMSGDREKCLAAGMDDYVSKPIRAAELEEVLARAIAAVGATSRAAG